MNQKRNTAAKKVPDRLVSIPLMYSHIKIRGVNARKLCGAAHMRHVVIAGHGNAAARGKFSGGLVS
ncbi:hypothetical protein [Novosphingobium sp.]|uniref:hypothetical protein n=1 Tax=Novosphingobium sp. TaxID=1874826 RepID=UPI003D138A53